MSITKKKKKWARFPRSSDRLLDNNLRAISSILKHTKVLYVVDLKDYDQLRDQHGKAVRKRIRVYGTYNFNEDAIRIKILGTSVSGVHFYNRVKLIVKIAIHESLEKMRYGKFSIHHDHVDNWENDIYERMSEKQIAYIWSLLPPLPATQ